jgi:hypothetical protein
VPYQQGHPLHAVLAKEEGPTPPWNQPRLNRTNDVLLHRIGAVGAEQDGPIVVIDSLLSNTGDTIDPNSTVAVTSSYAGDLG